MPWDPFIQDSLLGTYRRFRERYCRQGAEGTFSRERLIGWDDVAVFTHHALMGPDDLRRLILQFTDIFPNAHHRSPKWSGMKLAVAHALGLVGQPIFRPIVVMGHSITNNGNINDDNRFGLCEFSDQPGIYLWVSRNFVRTALGSPAVDWKLWRQNHIHPHDNDCLCYPHSLHPDGIIDLTLSDLLVSLGGVLDGNIQPGRWPYTPPSDPDWENWPDSPIAHAREHEGARIDIWYPGSP